MTAVNDAPVANPIAATLAEDGSIVLNLMGAVSDVDGDALTLSVTHPQSGALVQNANGSYTYTPTVNYNGSDNFTYTVSDGQLTVGSSIRLTITAVNDIAVAVNDTAATNQGQTVRINVLGNDSDIDNSTGANAGLAARVIANPAHGSVSFNPDGSLNYTPEASFFGSDSFTYIANDGVADSNVAAATITVNAANRPPVAADDTATLNEDSSIRLALLANDSNPSGHALTLLIASQPAHGKLVLNADNTVTYTPLADWSGEDSFTYRLKDSPSTGAGLTSNLATVRLIVNAQADAPTLVLTDTAGQGRELFRTGWESVANKNTTFTRVPQKELEGWTSTTRPELSGGGSIGFEIWSSGDKMMDAQNKLRTVSAMEGKGNNWLELSNTGSDLHQALGLERSIETVAGATYTLSLDLAGHLGYSADHTRIGITLDGHKIGSDQSTSPAAALDWQTRSFTFIGKGGKQTLRIASDATKFDKNGRGMMLDNLALTETLPANTGWEDTAVPLSALSAALTDSDGSETLILTLEAIPVGATLTDGTRSFTASQDNTTANITGWNPGKLTLTPPKNHNGQFTLKIIATATEQANQAKATTIANLQVTVLPVNDEDDDHCHHANGNHNGYSGYPGFGPSGYSGYPGNDNDGRCASLTVQSAHTPREGRTDNRSGYIVVNQQNNRPASKVDWAGCASASLLTQSLKDENWVAGSLGSKQEKKSLGEMTGLVFKVPRLE